MVEGGGLENRCPVMSGTGGSNPSPSARFSEQPRDPFDKLRASRLGTSWQEAAGSLRFQQKGFDSLTQPKTTQILAES